MKTIDRLAQRWRIAMAEPYLPRGSRVLDIGCADGALFRRIGSRIGEGIGLDPFISETETGRNWRTVRGWFPDALTTDEQFDAITMLAVLEHIPPEHQPRLADNCARFLKPNGVLIVTVPSPRVDAILGGLKAMRIIDGMSLEEHYGYIPEMTPGLFASEMSDLALVKQSRFQLGLNNLYVFQKVPFIPETAVVQVLADDARLTRP